MPSGRKPCPNATTLCHCVLSFHSPFSFFHDLVVGTEDLVTGVPFGSGLISALRPTNPMIVS